jgi:hypothetical protein
MKIEKTESHVLLLFKYSRIATLLIEVRKALATAGETNNLPSQTTDYH